MSRTTVKISLKKQPVVTLQTKTSARAARKAAFATRNRVKRNISTIPRVDTGKMRDSVHVETRKKGVTSSYSVISRLKYTIYQEKGVRPFSMKPGGPLLRFKPKGANTFVFARKVKGFPAGNFFKDAYNDISTRDFT